MISIGKEIEETAHRLGITEHIHHAVSSEQRIGLVHFLSAKMLSDYKYAYVLNKVPGLRDIEVSISSRNKVARTSVDIHARKSIWGSFSSDSEYTIFSPGFVELYFSGAKFTFWVVTRWSDGRAQEVEYQLLSYEHKDAALAEILLRKFSRVLEIIDKDSKVINVVNGPDIQIGTQASWEHLVLDKHVLRSTKDDIEGWIEAEERYRKLGIPYKRGYLFEGPPGNGKTAVARTIISTYGFAAFMFDFSEMRATDASLQDAFRRAAESAPAIFLLEDVDRIFEKSQMRSQITLSGVFNCLDGAATYDGVVVIATANNPELLDPALRLRPGRFDVPVRFNNPSAELRLKYLYHLFHICEIDIDEQALVKTVERTDGMSMAFVKSIFETAAGLTKGNVTGEALIEAGDQVVAYYKRMETSKERKTGFNVDKKKKKKYPEEEGDKSQRSPGVKIVEEPQSDRYNKQINYPGGGDPFRGYPGGGDPFRG